MSKPPHKFELPQLDDLFDDTFERNARRVLSAAERLEQVLEGAAQAVSDEHRDEQRQQRPATAPQRENQRSLAYNRTSMFGSLLLGFGIIAATFALTLFALNSYSGKEALGPYVWPIGLAGQVLILTGFWLRTLVRGWANRPNQGNSGDPATLGSAPFAPTRWDQGHALPALPERGKHSSRTGQRQS